MPIQTVDIRLDDVGYPGWYVRLRTNPRSSVYDALTQTEDLVQWWKAFGQVMLEWNLADEDGQSIPHPSTVESEKDLDLPISLLAYVLTRYFEAVREASAVPKASSDNSAPTSSTSVGSLTSA